MNSLRLHYQALIATCPVKAVNFPILSSTFLLTLLLMVGLFFFIRASVKERLQQVQLIAEVPEASLLPQLKEYFQRRAYQVATVDAAANQVRFRGWVRPSGFLAVFLSALAACGLLCFSVVLAFLYPAGEYWFVLLTLLSPLAGWFYWRKAGRTEEVLLQVESLPEEEGDRRSLITVTAHRDELANLQQVLPLKARSPLP